MSTPAFGCAARPVPVDTRDARRARVRYTESDASGFRVVADGDGLRSVTRRATTRGGVETTERALAAELSGSIRNSTDVEAVVDHQRLHPPADLCGIEPVLFVLSK
jgi:hypothetical protein